MDLFTTTEPRWLEVELDQVKQPRILLGSVPYALKSADADTLGGLPASAYLHTIASSAVSVSNPPAQSATTVRAKKPLDNSGTPVVEVNGDLTVDGNINLGGTIQATGGAGAVFQVPNDSSGNLGVGLGALQSNNFTT